MYLNQNVCGARAGASTRHGERSLKANLYSELQAAIKKITVEKCLVYFFNKEEAVILKVE